MNQESYRDTWAEVNLTAIAENIRAIKQLYQGKDVDIMAVVKANGYGHGAVPVAKQALKFGASYLAVALLDEAIILRKADIQAPILVLGRIRPQDVGVASQYNILVTVFQAEWLEEARNYLSPEDKIQVHIKFDTGMGRVGIRTKEEADSLLEFLANHSKQFSVNGVYTHFATADETDTSYVTEQHERFVRMLEWLKKWNINAPLIHSGNSAAGMRFPEKTFNLFRLGISMYGLTPSPEITEQLPVKLKQAFSLKSRLVQVKKLPKGEAISYGATYRTEKEEWIGTIPIGYADGWLRYHSTNGGEVLVNGKRAPFVGRICMDQCMILLPEQVEVGTVVTLIGEDGFDKITMDEVAQRLETINYEIPCIIGQRVPRVYMD
ncbi:alanine racemase [Halalkalibacter akibai]|uniref:Alanine racemase n=1 Tax=Halalkalibacter akibai (strain ATCC 43226 / DSM 21942 / CIP 109018 / JCM 9157 / 1139) TaxID=1236973 RepID=W4QXS1_HALA3|nr:alanine racemase [Halalkalibacter akibai]GAE36896.1 alanine racemase [Halalkalibacter akibai JCM 9157]